MTKIALTPNPSGTGTFTIAAPNSNSNRTFTLPDAAGEVLTDQSDLAAAKLTGDVAAARITDALNAGGSAPLYACRAWVNFNGTTATPSTIRGSGNVSSVTRNAAGNYTVNLTTAMVDTNASLSSAGGRYNNGTLIPVQGPQVQMTSSSTIDVRCGSDSTFLVNWEDVYVQVFQ